MKVTELDTKEVTVTVTRYILNEKVFDLEECPDWAQYAAVDEDGTAFFICIHPVLVYTGIGVQVLDRIVF